ncbi:helix-turn-helix domain-containing protein [Cupriavidus basilensis]|uniref:helix-turn-helix domain-containing protein n=1 Tax=Cupriavidus basilensis TaxID=68895 RepID=UPI0018CEEE47|nr:helix-turn-helix domain-containing protein [Cupriavidus basilensis]
MHIGERIRALRKDLGLTQADLARYFNITNVSVSEWERGIGKPDQEKLPALARKLQTSVVYLLTGRDDAKDTDKPTEALLHLTSGLPVIPSGGAFEWSQKMPAEQEKFAGERILCPFQHSEGAFITNVIGESMFDPSSKKSFSDGDYIVVDPNRGIRQGSIALIKVATGEIVRQVLIEPDQTVLMQALNPRWPDRIQKMDEGDTIIGVVIGKWVSED